MTRTPRHGLWTHQVESFHEFEPDELINPQLQAYHWRAFIPETLIEFDWQLGLQTYTQTLLEDKVIASASWPWLDRPWQQLFWRAHPCRELGRFWLLAQTAPERLSDTREHHPGLERLAQALGEPWPSLEDTLARCERFFRLAAERLGERFRWFMFAPLVDPLRLGFNPAQLFFLIERLVPEDERAPFFERVTPCDDDDDALAAAQRAFDALSLEREGSRYAACQLVRWPLPKARAALAQRALGDDALSPALRRAIIDLCLEGPQWSMAVAREDYTLSPDLAPWLLTRLAPQALPLIMSKLLAQPQALMDWIPSLMRVHSPHAVRGFMMLAMGDHGPSARAARAWLMSEGANAIAICHEVRSSATPEDEVLKPLAQELLDEYSARGHEHLVASLSPS